MVGINVFENGEIVSAHIERMFVTHGPYQINGYRLDQLKSIDLLVDSSTSTSTVNESGTITTKAKTGNLIGRTIVGATVLGGPGAIIGGTTGTKSSISSSTSVITETKNHQLTAKLTFYNKKSLNVFITDLEGYHWLLGMTGQKPMTQKELEVEKGLAAIAKEEAEKNQVLDKIVEDRIRRVDKMFTAPFDETKYIEKNITALGGIVFTILFLIWVSPSNTFTFIIFLLIGIFVAMIPTTIVKSIVIEIYSSRFKKKIEKYKNDRQKAYDKMKEDEINALKDNKV
ncbi:MAG: hypothetical protein ACOYNS_11155 [Bacteroidota bacterium]